MNTALERYLSIVPSGGHFVMLSSAYGVISTKPTDL
jgi:hypothetical protein